MLSGQTRIEIPKLNHSSSNLSGKQRQPGSFYFVRLVIAGSGVVDCLFAVRHCRRIYVPTGRDCLACLVGPKISTGHFSFVCESFLQSGKVM